ncbi:MAG: hypothetical protein ABRQ37_14275 [Candidatus Eremiobacterota bacterium]
MLCGVFVYGLNAINKGRLRTGAFNIADKKIVQVRRLMKAVQATTITGEELRAILTDGDTSLKTLTINDNPVTADSTSYTIWPDPAPMSLKAEGKVMVKGTATYNYTLSLTYRDLWLKKVRVEVTWEEERVGPQKVVLESIVSRGKNWPLHK